MSRIEVNELRLEEESFATMSHRQLTGLFEKHKKISVEVGHKNRIDLTYVEGHKHGIKYTEMINLLHVERLPRHYTDDPDDDRFKTVTDKLLSPLSFGKAVKKFHTYYQRLKEGKVMKIKDLTQDEINEIIRLMNAPIGDCDE